jgi:anti-sigma B factor antagonist
MQCDHVRRDGKLILNARGRLEVTSVAEFDRYWEACVQGEDTDVVLDLTGLEFITSAGLRGVLGLHKMLKARGGHLILCGLTGVVAEVFAISGLSFVMPIYGDLDEALQPC